MKQTVFLLLLVFISSSISAQTQTTASDTRTRRTADGDIDNTADPVASLRDQIQAAETGAERNRLQLKLADLLASTGHKTEALAELQLIAKSDAFDPTGFYNLGNSFARLGDSEAAIDAYRTAIEQRKGRYSRAYNNLGVLLLRSGRWDEAHDALLSALKLESFRYAEASYNLGRVYAARGQYDLAAREWRRALAVNPEHDAAAQALAHGRNDERIVVASQPAATRSTGVKVAPISPAAASSVKSLELDQTSFDFMQRARSASERGKLTEAVDNFRRVLSRQGGYFAPANLELSFALLTLKRNDEALANLIQVSQRDGARYPISYFHLARLYELKGELKLAEAAFSQAATSYQPTNAQFLLDLSRVREKLGDYKGALEALEKFVTLMESQGQKPAWSDERLAELKTKAQK
ncbi:MAG TPA: tetratricopeptide repeat protein [Pyrinomonadaceae bacterium]|nr:tetratricopeptide repeat protein [Pyrinomonadaceae bacterium]